MFKFEFNENEINIILKGLSELPLKEVALVFNKIQSELIKGQE